MNQHCHSIDGVIDSDWTDERTFCEGLKYKLLLEVWIGFILE